jgi:hypothetical protein
MLENSFDIQPTNYFKARLSKAVSPAGQTPKLTVRTPSVPSPAFASSANLTSAFPNTSIFLP